MNRETYLISIITLILIGCGLISIYSTTAIFAEQSMGDPFFFFRRQLLWVVVGSLALFAAMRIKYDLLRKINKPLLVLGVFLLVLVLFPQFGREAGGARRWLLLGGFSFQPVEIVKLFLIVYLARYLADKQKCLGKLHGFLPPVLVIMLVGGLVIFQPNLGTALLLVMVSFIMLFVGGVKISYLVGTAISFIPVLYFLVFDIAFRRRRILAFLDPWSDPSGVGYQIIQSLLALGSGGLWGVGLGRSQQKLFFLPASHTDFIFSIIGEEIGLIGTGAIMVLFILFIWIGIKIAWSAPDLFGYLLSIGITMIIGLQAAINIGVATGSLPTMGISLPFISFGGSSLVTTMAGVGLLLNVSRSSTSAQNQKLKIKTC
ncbi:putative lipid II flippase FtsW [candidate division NPL-UPA2 bacterium Unc8]|uniref:Probable peptidoglycan glycosyltransferase FtsW n=1 Tax=candidate division NPL-UPA2 bacterium Unc8 TaxID=1980939 RepID=A0A399FWF6_UNCN2|nr:putative peptidoglycan glycosyltransferase FtsW [Bacillota bacterium]RIH99759.1 MAG: putative lipid II flippase FtsW [candidate division NPL-UPA2 bacterium Unc8]